MTVRRQREAERRRREGSVRGAQAVRREFEAALTRRRFCEAVGIHPTTLRRWESARVVKPRLKTILGSPTFVYTTEDVLLGKAIVKLLAEQRGVRSLTEAARIASERARKSARSTSRAPRN